MSGLIIALIGFFCIFWRLKSPKNTPSAGHHEMTLRQFLSDHFVGVYVATYVKLQLVFSFYTGAETKMF